MIVKKCTMNYIVPYYSWIYLYTMKNESCIVLVITSEGRKGVHVNSIHRKIILDTELKDIVSKCPFETLEVQ